jgi:hypothetical protein
LILINAKWASKKVQVELTSNSSALPFLEKYFKKAGYTLNDEVTFQRVMKRDNEAFLLYKVKEPFQLYFNGRDDVSQPFLNTFPVSSCLFSNKNIFIYNIIIKALTKNAFYPILT